MNTGKLAEACPVCGKDADHCVWTNPTREFYPRIVTRYEHNETYERTRCLKAMEGLLEARMNYLAAEEQLEKYQALKTSALKNLNEAMKQMNEVMERFYQEAPSGTIWGNNKETRI